MLCPIGGYIRLVAIGLSLLLLAGVLGITVTLILATVHIPDGVDLGGPTLAPSPITAADHGKPRLRLSSRLLFARRSLDAITLDCTLLEAAGDLPPDVHPPAGLPFTLRVRCPDTGWFAGRVEELLNEWADDNRELMLELSSEHGKVRTTIASGGSSVHLELAGAAGLGSDLSAA